MTRTTRKVGELGEKELQFVISLETVTKSLNFKDFKFIFSLLKIMDCLRKGASFTITVVDRITSI